jgi:hypothetical protein
MKRFIKYNTHQKSNSWAFHIKYTDAIDIYLATQKDHECTDQPPESYFYGRLKIATANVL